MTDDDAPPPSPLDELMDEDLMDIFQAIRDGARTPAEALELDAATLNSCEEMAQGYLEAKLYDRAGPLYGLLLRLEPERGAAWRGMGLCLQELGQLEAAGHCYREAVRCAPEDRISRLFFGECLCRLGERDDGLGVLEAVIEGGAPDAREAPYVERAKAIIAADGLLPGAPEAAGEGEPSA